MTAPSLTPESTQQAPSVGIVSSDWLAVLHEPRYRRHQRGCAMISGRPVYGWSVACSCGWEMRTNENKRYVEKRFRAHQKTSSANKVDSTYSKE